VAYVEDVGADLDAVADLSCLPFDFCLELVRVGGASWPLLWLGPVDKVHAVMAASGDEVFLHELAGQVGLEAGLRSKYFRSSGCGMRSEWRVSAGPLGLLA
jgi:hypothetical protein